MNKQFIDGIAEVLKTAEPAIECAYIFGSVAKGMAKSNSDIDIAILGEKLDTNEKLRLIQAIANITGRSVDWVDLKDIGATVAFEAINGIRLLGSDEQHAQLLAKTLVDASDYGLLYERMLSERREAWFNE